MGEAFGSLGSYKARAPGEVFSEAKAQSMGR